MHMVGHYHPSQQPVTLSVEEKKRVLYHLRNRRLTQNTRSMPRIDPGLHALSSLCILLFGWQTANLPFQAIQNFSGQTVRKTKSHMLDHFVLVEMRQISSAVPSPRFPDEISGTTCIPRNLRCLGHFCPPTRDHFPEPFPGTANLLIGAVIGRLSVHRKMNVPGKTTLFTRVSQKTRVVSIRTDPLLPPFPPYNRIVRPSWAEARAAKLAWVALTSWSNGMSGSPPFARRSTNAASSAAWPLSWLEVLNLLKPLKP